MKIQKLYDYLTENQNHFFRVAFSYTKNEADALDVVQDAICKALHSFSHLKNAVAMRTWFYRILIHTALDKWRKNQVEVPTEISADSLREVDTYQSDYDDLAKALDTLDEKYRTVVILRYFEDLKLEEISLITNTNLSTVKSRLYKALSDLKMDLNEEKELLS